MNSSFRLALKSAKKRKPEPTALGWVGLVHDNIDLEHGNGYGIVYKTRREAKNYYTAVRRVRLIVVGR